MQMDFGLSFLYELDILYVFMLVYSQVLVHDRGFVLYMFFFCSLGAYTFTTR